MKSVRKEAHSINGVDDRLRSVPTICIVGLFLFFSGVIVLLSACPGRSNQTTISDSIEKDNIHFADLPQIGEVVTSKRAVALCKYYGYHHLGERIENNPELFKEWKFDGCSMTPDAVLSEIINVPTLTEICLRHDLGYAYGKPGDELERKAVDKRFKNELVSGGASAFAANTMFEAVRMGGGEKLCLPFSWGFARTEPCKPGVGFQSVQSE